MHFCFGDDYPRGRIVCFCAIGKDHTEEDME